MTEPSYETMPTRFLEHRKDENPGTIDARLHDTGFRARIRAGKS